MFDAELPILPDEEKAHEAALLSLRHQLDDVHGADGPRPLAVLIDPAVADPLDHELRAERERPGAAIDIATLNIAHPDLAKSARPYLLVIYDELRQEPLVNATVRLAVRQALQGTGGSPEGARSICAWLIAPPVPASAGPAYASRWAREAALHFTSQALVRSPYDRFAPARLWRFWDPRGVSCFAPALTAEQRRQWLHPVQRWISLLQTGADAGRQLILGSRGAVPPLVDAPEPLTFTPEQWALLRRIGPAHELMRAAALGLGEAPAQALAWKDADRLMHRAQQAGLPTAEEWLCFAAHAFKVHPELDRHPDVRQLLHASLGNPAVSLRASFAAQPASFWARVQHELGHSA